MYEWQHTRINRIKEITMGPFEKHTGGCMLYVWMYGCYTSVKSSFLVCGKGEKTLMWFQGWEGEERRCSAAELPDGGRRSRDESPAPQCPLMVSQLGGNVKCLHQMTSTPNSGLATTWGLRLYLIIPWCQWWCSTCQSCSHLTCEERIVMVLLCLWIQRMEKDPQYNFQMEIKS